MALRLTIGVTGLLVLAGAGRPVALAYAPAAKTTGCYPQQPASLPRLTGVVVANGGRWATFADIEGASRTTISEGESISGYSVVAITPTCVELRSEAGTYYISPVADPVFRAAMTASQPRSPDLAASQQAQVDNDK